MQYSSYISYFINYTLDLQKKKWHFMFYQFKINWHGRPSDIIILLKFVERLPKGLYLKLILSPSLIFLSTLPFPLFLLNITDRGVNIFNNSKPINPAILKFIMIHYPWPRCMIRDVAVKVPEPEDFIAEAVFPSHIVVPRCSGRLFSVSVHS